MPRLAVTSCSRRIDGRRAYDLKTPARTNPSRETRPDVAARTIRKLHRWGGESPLSNGSSVQAGWSGPTHRFAQPRRKPLARSFAASRTQEEEATARRDAARARADAILFLIFLPLPSPVLYPLLHTRPLSHSTLLLPLPRYPSLHHSSRFGARTGYAVERGGLIQGAHLRRG